MNNKEKVVKFGKFILEFIIVGIVYFVIKRFVL